MVGRATITVLALLVLSCTGASANHGKHQGHHDHHDGHHSVSASKNSDAADGLQLFTGFTDGDVQKTLLFPSTSRPHVNCSHYCNDHKLDTNELMAEGEHPKVCIGNFKIFCTGHTNKTCGMYGLKCEGQFTYARMANKTRFAACEGLFKEFVKKESVDVHDNMAYKVTKANGCLGTSSAFMHGGGHHGNHTHNDSALAVMGGSFEDGQLDDAVMHTDLSAVDNTTHGIVEGRCSGLSGRVTVVGKKHVDTNTATSGFADLEASVDQTLAEASVELLPKSPFAGLMDAAEPEFSKHVHIDCRMTCNRKPAWLHGKFPCWGKFEVECDIDRAQRESLQAKDSAQPFTLAAGPDVLFRGSCEGFWSGVLGKKCMGFAKSHIDARHADAWDFCSGREGVFAKHRHGSAAMGQYCKGKHLVAVTFERNSTRA